MVRLILDTTALINLERRWESRLQPSDDFAIASISFAELLHGVVAADPKRRKERQEFAEDVRENIEILPYTKDTAAEHAVLLDYVRRTGKPRGAHDLIIAAHARQTGRTVYSDDAKARFGDLPGVNVWI